MTEFNDTSTATRLEKAKRVLRHLADGKDMTYFFDDGYPREKVLQNDARAALEVLEELEQKPPTPQQVSDYMAMVESVKNAVGHNNGQERRS